MSPKEDPPSGPPPTLRLPPPPPCWAGSAGAGEGERALAEAPLAVALPAASGQLGTTQPAHVYVWGHFSLPGIPTDGPALPPADAPFSPGYPSPPGKLHTAGWTRALSWGGLAARARCPAQAPHPRGPARGPGAAFGLKSVYGHTWKEPSRRSPSRGDGRAFRSSGRALRGEDDLRGSPLPRRPQRRIK